MTARAAAFTAAAFVLCGGMLSGCVAVPPPGPTADDVKAYRADLLARSWANTGLTGDAPVAEAITSSSDEQWLQSVSDCLAGGDAAGAGWSFGPDDGYRLLELSDSDVDGALAQRAFYRCVASRLPPVSDIDVRTDEQLDYIYDYYLSTLVPCMELNGFAPQSAPTRVEFHVIAGQWSPFYAVDVGLTPRQYDDLTATCGSDLPPLR